MLTFAISGCENIVLVPGRSSGAITESSEASEPLSAYPVTLNDTEILKAPEKNSIAYPCLYRDSFLKWATATG